MNKPQVQLKIRSLRARLDALQGGPLAREVNDLLSQAGEYARQKSVDSPAHIALTKLATEVAKIKGDPRIDNLSNSLTEYQVATDAKTEELRTAFLSDIQALAAQAQEAITMAGTSLEGKMGKSLSDALSSVLQELDARSTSFDQSFNSLAAMNGYLDGEIEKIRQEIGNVSQTIKVEVQNSAVASTKSLDTAVTEVRKLIGDVTDEVARVERRINTIAAQGSGNMNRNIAINGNTSVLSKWTDINLRPGANMTITYSSNDTTGYTDILFTSSGGGGGTSRSVNTISTSQTADGTPSTDFVYIANAGIKLTLPTAAGNNNLYTVKNTGTSSVMVVPSGTDTIDNDANVIMPIRYTAIDLISDGSGNWNIT